MQKRILIKRYTISRALLLLMLVLFYRIKSQPETAVPGEPSVVIESQPQDGNTLQPRGPHDGLRYNETRARIRRGYDEARSITRRHIIAGSFWCLACIPLAVGAAFSTSYDDHDKCQHGAALTAGFSALGGAALAVYNLHTYRNIPEHP